MSVVTACCHAQAERGGDPGAAEAVAMQGGGAGGASADALARASMRESHLANFRMEAKRRWALPQPSALRRYLCCA